MSPRIFPYLVLGAFIMGGMEGCAIFQSGSSSTLPSSAFFPIDAAELKPLQAIGQAQDVRMKNCHRGAACEEAYYTRGLVALFENRADAVTVFQELHTAMPNSRYDAATTGWVGNSDKKCCTPSWAALTSRRHATQKRVTCVSRNSAADLVSGSRDRASETS